MSRVNWQLLIWDIPAAGHPSSHSAYLEAHRKSPESYPSLVVARSGDFRLTRGAIEASARQLTPLIDLEPTDMVLFVMPLFRESNR